MGKPAKWIKKILGLKKKSSSKDKTPTKEQAANKEHQIPATKTNEVPQIVSVPQVTSTAYKKEVYNVPPLFEEASLPPPRADLQICPPKLQDRQIQCTDEAVDQEHDDEVNRDDVGYEEANDDDIFPKVISKEDLAAVKIQKAFRSYLARRALRALRSVIRLQSLARGHAVRRQAAGALRCVQAIVRVQAIFRGRQVRLSEEGQAIQYLLQRHRQQTDAWQMADQEPYRNIYRASSASVKDTDKALAYALQRQVEWSKTKKQPLYVDSALESGSGWGWLQRWTAARPWAFASLTDPAELSTSGNSPMRADNTRVEVPVVEADNTSPAYLYNFNPRHDETTLAPKLHLTDAEDDDHFETEHVQHGSLAEEDDDDTPNIEDSPDVNEPVEHSADNGHFQQATEYTEFEKEANGHSPQVEEQVFDDADDDHLPDEDEEGHSPVQHSKIDYFSVESTPQKTPSVPSYMAATQSAKAKVRSQSPKSSSPTVKKRFSIPGPNSKTSAEAPRRLSLPGANGGDASPRRLSLSNGQPARSPQLRSSISTKSRTDRQDNGVRRSSEMRRSFKF